MSKIALLFVVLSVFAAVLANGESDLREASITLYGNNDIFIDSESLTTSTNNQNLNVFQLDAQAYKNYYNPKIEIQLGYWDYNVTRTITNTSTSISESDKAFVYATRPFSIIKYVETSTQVVNGANVTVQNGYQAGNDTHCSTYTITSDGFTWRYLGTTVVSNTTAIQNFEGSQFTQATRNGPLIPGPFTIVLHATGTANTQQSSKKYWGSEFTLDGRTVSPTGIKFDLIFDATQLTGGSTDAACTSNYQIAYVSWTRSIAVIASAFIVRTIQSATVHNHTFSYHTTTINDTVSVISGGGANPFGYFTWATTAQANNTEGDVVTANVITGQLTTPQDNLDNDLCTFVVESIHSFDVINPTTIAWDPEFFTATTAVGTGTTSNALATASTSFALLVSLIATVLVAIRQ